MVGCGACVGGSVCVCKKREGAHCHAMHSQACVRKAKAVKKGCLPMPMQWWREVHA